jgi:hypothetical protein
MTQGSCAHIETIKTIKHAKRRECEDCVKSGSSWVHRGSARNAAVRAVAMTRRTATQHSMRARANIR